MALKDKVVESIGITGVVILTIALVIVGPFIGVWAIKTLWRVDIGYTFWTWLASLLFFWACGSAGKSK